MKDKVSIVIPIFNVEAYLERCLNSVLAQTWTEWECILINDGSQDNSLVIARKYADKDDRFLLISQENRGLSAARNRGIRKSTGTYICFLDSDDFLAPNFLERMLKCIISNQADVSVCRYSRFGELDIPEKSNTNGSEEVLSSLQAVKKVLVSRERYMITAWGKIYKRELFDYIEYPEGKVHEDEFVTYKIYAKCQKIVAISDKLYYYFVRGNSIMGQYTVNRLDILEAFRDSIFYIQKTIPELYEHVFLNYLFNLAIAYYRVHQSKLDEQIERHIREEFQNNWIKFKNIRKNEKKDMKNIAAQIFSISPSLFCLGAWIYLKIAKEE